MLSRDQIEALAHALRDVGFPIAIAVYLIVRLDLLLRDNTAALWALQAAVMALTRSQTQ